MLNHAFILKIPQTARIIHFAGTLFAIMKIKKITMKKSINILFVAIVTSLFFACGSGNKDGVEQANDMNEKKDSSGSMMTLDDNETEFLVEALSGGMMEVELGNLAQQKSSNNDIKEFGKMMSTDHTNANNAIQSVASMKSVTTPTSMSEDHMKMVNDLRTKTGREFDKDYISMMVNDHKKDVDKFEKMSTDAKDDDVRAMAAKILPTLRMHLETAVKIEDSIKK